MTFLDDCRLQHKSSLVGGLAFVIGGLAFLVHESALVVGGLDPIVVSALALLIALGGAGQDARNVQFVGRAIAQRGLSPLADRPQPPSPREPRGRQRS